MWAKYNIHFILAFDREELRVFDQPALAGAIYSPGCTCAYCGAAGQVQAVIQKREDRYILVCDNCAITCCVINVHPWRWVMTAYDSLPPILHARYAELVVNRTVDILARSRIMEDQHIQLLDNSQAHFSSNDTGASCIRVSHSVIVRAPGLLPMWYTPNELEEELRISARIIREWLSKGLSHQRDERGHILVDGRRMAAWVKAIGQPQPKHKLEDDEAYCLSCRQPVKLTTPTNTQRGRQVLWRGVCPICGSAICRGGRHG